jgi:hypothetical protein
MTKEALWPGPVTVVATASSVLAVLSVYRDRNRWRERELLDRVRKGLHRSLGARFITVAVPGLAVVLTAVVAWKLVLVTPHSTLPDQESLLEQINRAAPFIVAVGYLFVMPALVYSSSLSAALSYASRMNQQVPLPIFLDTARLVKLVQAQAELDFPGLGPGLVWEGMERTRRGGIKIRARHRHDRKVLEDLAGKKIDLPLHTKYEVLADPWGRMIDITPTPELQV